MLNKSIKHNWLFGIILLLFFLEDIANIFNSVDSFTRLYIAGIPVRDIILFIMLSYFVINYNRIIAVIGSSKALLWSFGILLLFVIRSFYNHELFGAPVRADLRAVLWFFGGISVGYIFIKIRNKELVLFFTTISFLCFIIMSSVLSESYSVYSTGGYIRVSHPSMFLLSAGFMPIFILFTNLYGHSRSTLKLSLLAIWSVFTYYSAILSATRSMLLLSLVIFINGYISFQSKIENNKFLITRNIGYKTILVLLALVMVFPVIMPAIDVLGRFSQTLNLYGIISNVRAAEAIDFYQQMSFNDFLIGKGLGGTIRSTIYNFEATNSLHIGILSLWMKYGVIPVILFLIILVRSLYLYYKSLKYKVPVPGREFSSRIILPMIFPFFLSLVISGGAGEGNFLMYGFIYLLYGHYNKNSI